MDFAQDGLVTNSKNNNKEHNKFLSVIYKIYQITTKVILYILITVLILAALLFMLYFIDLQKNIKAGVSKQPLFGAYIIISPSMVPTIKVEDAIVIQRKEANELKKGDIITFKSSDPRYSGVTITHRIVEVQKQGKEYFYKTKGDNNNTPDAALVSYKNVYGKVLVTIPKIGYLQSFLTNSYGWVLIIVIPCLFIIISDLIKLFKSIKKTVTPKKKEITQKTEEYIEVIDPKNQKNENKDKEEQEELEII